MKKNINETDILDILADNYELSVDNILRLKAFQDINFLVTARDIQNRSTKFVLKISEVRKEEYDVKVARLEFQRQIIDHLFQNSFAVGPLLRTKNGNIRVNLKSGQIVTDTKDDATIFVLRVQVYVPGEILESLICDDNTVYTAELLHDLGAFIGQLHLSLQAFTTNYDELISKNDEDDLWLLENFTKMANILGTLESDDKRKCTENAIEMFKQFVLPSTSFLKKGVIHGDLHDQNILTTYQVKEWKRNRTLKHQKQTMQTISEKNTKQYFGLIDFGDSCYSCYIFEIAMIIRDILTELPQLGVVEIGRHVLKGYREYITISTEELEILPICILAGLCQYFVLGEYEFKRQPENEYVKYGSEEAWQEVQKLMKMDFRSIVLSWS